MNTAEVQRVLFWVLGCFLVGAVLAALAAMSGCVTVNRPPIIIAPKDPPVQPYQTLPYIVQESPDKG